MERQRIRSTIATILGRACAAFIVLSSSNHASGEPLSADCTNTIFEDNFAGPEIDRQKWNVLSHSKSQRTPLTGLQNYTDDAVLTGVTGLKLRMERSKDGEYTSGRIVSRQTFRYGRFEINAKLPVGRGLWPAIWMRTPTNLPLDGEIDILEGFGSDPSSIQSTLHPWTNGHEARQYCVILKVHLDAGIRRHGCKSTAVELGSDLSREFHRYAMVWRPHRMSWSIDGIQYYTVNSEIPDEPMSIVINLAISPLHDGTPDNSLKLPQYLSVKSVRVCPLNN